MKSLEILFEEKLIENSEKMGKFLLKNLEKLKSYDFVKDIRGRGLFCGVEFKEDYPKNASELCEILKKNGLLAKPTQRNIIRFSPPLIIKKKQLKICIEIIKKSFEEYANN